MQFSNLLACEQAVCLGKKIARKGKGKRGGEGGSLFSLPSSPLDQRPVHRLAIYESENLSDSSLHHILESENFRYPFSKKNGVTWVVKYEK